MQKKNLPISAFVSVLLIIIILFSGCKPTIYTSPKFSSEREQHKILAILPFDVTIAMKKLPQSMTVEMLREMEEDEAYGVQGEIYTYFLKRTSEGRYTIEFQDIDTTNALLSKAEIAYGKIRNYSKSELAEILNVDVVLSGRIRRSKPMTTGAAIALAVLFAPFGTTNKVDVDVAIHSRSDSKLIWNYNHTYSGGIGSSPQRLTKALMKHISKKFPYSKK